MPRTLTSHSQSVRQELTKQTRAKYHILLAEDDDEMRAMLVLALTHEGYNVIECRDGDELSLCLSESKYRNSEPIDLVISDIRMPRMQGLSTLVPYCNKARCPPMVLMTAFGDSATREKAAQMGVVAFFDKPFELDDLVRNVDRIIFKGQ